MYIVLCLFESRMRYFNALLIFMFLCFLGETK